MQELNIKGNLIVHGDIRGVLHDKPRKLPGSLGYLYEVEYNDYDYSVAKSWKFDDDLPMTGCSTCRHGNLIGRNFDWYFDNNAEFIVRSSKPDCNMVLGVAGSLDITP